MKSRLLTLILVYCLSLIWAGFSSAKEIKVLFQEPLSGVAGAFPEIGWGVVDGIDYINKTGGVNGKSIKAILEDMRYDVPTGVSIFTRYSSAESPEELLVTNGYMTGVIKALSDKVNKEQKIPWLDGSYSTELFGPEGGPSKYPYYFSLGATYGDQISLLIKWVKQNYKGQGNPKLAIVYSPGEFGRDPLSTARNFAKKIGVDIVAEEEVPYTATDVTSQVTNVKRAGTKYLIFHGFAGHGPATSLFLKTAKQFLKDVQIMGTHYTTGVMTFLSAGAEAVDGMIGASCSPMVYETDNPLIKLALDLAKQNKREIKDLAYYAELINIVGIIREAMVRADKAQELTREGIKKSLENLTWDFMGRHGGKISSYKTHTIPMLRLYQAHGKDQKWVPISEWINVTEELK